MFSENYFDYVKKKEKRKKMTSTPDRKFWLLPKLAVGTLCRQNFQYLLTINANLKEADV